MKKIMFNDRFGLTDAVIEKRKTVTRRLIAGQMSQCWLMDCKDRDFQLVIEGNNLNAYTSNKELYYSFGLPYKVGEIVAVAQSYFDIWSNLVDIGDSYTYHGCKGGFINAINYHYKGVHHSQLSGWTNKMFVKAKLMPRKIRILDVRAERLQDITDEDCLREGISEERPEFYDLPTGSEKIYFHYHNFNPDAPDYSTFGSAKEAFATLIDKISGKGTWKSNPFVWRIEFELVK